MRTTSNAFRLEPESGIPLIGIKKLSMGLDAETFLAKAGVGKKVVSIRASPINIAFQKSGFA